jgi:hypothetical protein
LLLIAIPVATVSFPKQCSSAERNLASNAVDCGPQHQVLLLMAAVAKPATGWLLRADSKYQCHPVHALHQL